MLIRIVKKLHTRYIQFKKHELVKNSLFALCRYVYINIKINVVKKPFTVNWYNNIQYYLKKGDSSLISNYYFKIFDYEETIFLFHYLNNKDLFIDVGANQGLYTLATSGIIGCDTVAIEPVPETFRRLKLNIELNKLKNVQLVQKIISNKKSLLNISVEGGELNKVVLNKTSKKTLKAESISLDELIDPKTDVSCIKIDVEGFEKMVLEGAERILKSVALNVILIELNNSNLYYNYEENEIIDILKKHSFKPYKYDPINKNLIELKIKNKKSFNSIYIKDIDRAIKRFEEKKVQITDKEILIKKRKI